VTVLVVSDDGVDVFRVGGAQARELAHQLARLVAVVLAEEVGPVAGIDVRSVDQVAGEEQVGVAPGLRHLVLEDGDDLIVVAQTSLQVGAHDQATVGG
jgi:hypothetical protein